ncbi:MAG: hypothetical protein HKM02_12720 [Pseudomonadales bacterium]|nr:hypothetical protein [Pseudomonadales bacterium]
MAFFSGETAIIFNHHSCRAALGLLSGIMLAGCAAMDPPEFHHAVPVSSVQVVMDVRDSSLLRVFNMDAKQAATSTLLAQKRLQLAQQVREDMLTALQQVGVSLQPVSASSEHFQVRVTDYGETPVSWRDAYIGFEVVTTLAIAAAFYGHKVTRPLAGIYLLEESFEEISEGYAGFWVLNRWSRPVRMQVLMLRDADGVEVWRDHRTTLLPWTWSNLRQHDDIADREQRLSRGRKKDINLLVHDWISSCSACGSVQR